MQFRQRRDEELWKKTCLSIYLVYSWWRGYAANTGKLFWRCLSFEKKVLQQKQARTQTYHGPRLRLMCAFKCATVLAGQFGQTQQDLLCRLWAFEIACEYYKSFGWLLDRDYWVLLLGGCLCCIGLVMPAEASARPAMFATPQSTLGAGGFFNRTKYILIPRYFSSSFLGTRPTE